MTHFYFLRPYNLFFLIPLIFLLVGLSKAKLRDGFWGKYCDQNLLPFILKHKSGSNKISFIFLSIASILAIIALAGPSFDQISVPVIKQNQGLVIALDLSPSMNAEDLKPTRLQRALYKINDIIKLQTEGYTGLIVYTDEAFVVIPLTEDSKTIKALLQSLDPEIMPTHGLKHEAAIAKANEMLENGNIKNGSILLISAFDQNKEIALNTPQKAPILTLAISTDQGAPIPKGDGAFVLDKKGNIILSKLNKDTALHLSKSTNGRFAKITTDDSDIHYLLNQNITLEKDETHESMTHVEPQDSGYWFLLASLPFFAILLRNKGFLTVCLLIFTMQLQALSSDDLWLTADQRGKKAFDQEQYEQACLEFQEPTWQAASYYRAGKYEEALKLYDKDKSASGHYNRGNTLAKMGKINKAIAAYKKALKIDNEHEDAAFNKRVLEKLKDENKDKNDGNDQSDNDEDDDDNDDEDGSDNDDDEDNQDETDDDKGQDDKSSDKNEKDDKKSDDNDENDSKDPSSKDDLDNSKKDEKDQQEQQDQQDEKDPRDSPSEKDKDNDEKDDDNRDNAGHDDMTEINPQQQMDRQLLERVPDDPGGLLRRKFLYQYKQKNGNP